MSLSQNSPTPDATTTAKGKVQLANDLAGTAALPTVAKINGISITGTPAIGYAPIATSTSAATWQAVGGTGTVTNTGGSLTANSVVLGAGTNDTKVVAGIITDGTSKLTLGVAGTSVGSVDLKNATSGTVTLKPATGALGGANWTFPSANDTVVGLSTTDTLTNKTMSISSNTFQFSPGVSSQANAGTAGGTMKYINLGGIKMLWMTGGSVPTGTPKTVTFPTSFFTTIEYAIASIGTASGTAAVYTPEVQSLTATGCTIAMTAGAGSGTQPTFLHVIGT